ncbi:hypothetical protein HHI36_020644, partial [Cryptolaemus montrouzieri]
QTKRDTDLLKKDNTVLRTYQEAINQKLNLTESNTIGENWNKTRKAILDAAKDTLRKDKQERNGTWFEECRGSIQNKNRARGNMMARNTRSNKEPYNNLRRETRKMMKKKKGESLEREL